MIGNGDLLFPHEVREHLANSGCTAVMTARGALIKPWIFREVTSGYWDITAEERVVIYRRYVQLAAEHWGREGVLDEHGRERVGDFLKWHVGFWVRYAPRHADGSWPTMQQRESGFVPRSPLEALLARHDDAAIAYITDELIAGGDLSDPPPIGATETESVVTAAG